MDVEKKIKQEREEISGMLAKIEGDIQRLQKIAGGDGLETSGCKGITQYRVNGKYLPKKDNLKAQVIAQLDYSIKMKKVLKARLWAISNMILNYDKNRIEATYDRLCPGRKKIVTPIIEPTEEFVARWQAEKYEPYDYWDDVKTEIYTLKGERVRSKAEKLIADELLHYNVPYKYEYPLEVMVGRERKTLRPDFLTLNRRTRDEYVVEHFGMMDKLSYYNHNLDKLDVLERNGYMLGVNLLLFHETSESPLNILTVRRYIEEYLI